MAAGTGFLHWECDRPSRWLLPDGEMPDALIQQRISAVLRRHRVPAENLLIYAAGRAETFDDLIPDLKPMPPLNTPEGHAWVTQIIEILQPDGVLFDNLMSLAPGDHSKPDAWINTLPLVMALTKRGIAQIWCDHSGWDA